VQEAAASHGVSSQFVGTSHIRLLVNGIKTDDHGRFMDFETLWYAFEIL
jgi:hypothetical protein